MNKHYREALIEATVEHLQENCGVEDINRETLETILDDPEKWEETDDYSFEGDVECLADLYLEEEEEVLPTPEEEVDEILNKLHVGANYIPGIGLGYCHTEEDLESMKAWLKDRMLAAAYLARIFGSPAEEEE